MSFVAVQLFQSNITALLTNTGTVMKLPAAAAAQLAAAIGSSGTNFTSLSISNGTVSELVYATAVTGVNVTITRGVEGSTAQTFSSGAVVRFVWTEVTIQDVASGGTSGITITGSGQANVTGGPFNWNVAVANPVITAGTGIGITGTWPNITITNTSPGGGGGSTIVTGSGQANVTPISGGYNVDVPTPVVTGGTAISISGTWPNITITNTAPASGGSGTVTSVNAGAGISITGTPTINPTVALSPSGVTAGTYGGLTVDTYGRITGISAGLVTTITSLNPALVVSTPSSGVVNLNLNNATTSQAGIIQLAVNTAPASSNPADSTSAVSPSGIAAVVASLHSATVNLDVSNTPLPSVSYTTLAITGSTSITLAAGQFALVTVEIDVLDTVTPTNIPSYAIGLFNGGTLIDGNNVVPGAARTLVCKVNGPMTGTLSASTTTLGGTEVIQNKSLSVVIK